MKVCGVCGKRIAVMWPEFYVYKHGKGEDTTYYCSENCMIVADTREMKDRIGWVDPQAEMTEEEIEAVTHGRPVGFRRLRKTARREEQPAAPAGQEREDRTMAKYASSHKLTREEKERAVELAIDGKDPIGYLKELGLKNPWASWAYIKQTLRTKRPELYAKLPSDDDRLEEEISYGTTAEKETEDDQEAVDVQTAEGVGEPEAPADGTPAAGDEIPPRATLGRDDRRGAAERPVKSEECTVKSCPPEADELDGFKPYTPKRARGRLVMDEHGLHTVKDQEQPKPEKAMGAAENAEKVPDVDAGERPSAVARDPSTSVGMTADDAAAYIVINGKVTAEGVLKERSELIHDANGVRMITERLLDDLPCKITGLKINEFEFNMNRAGVVLILPESDRTFMQAMVTLTAEQWKRLVAIVPKVLKIFGMDK